MSAWIKSTDGIMLACNSRCAADFGKEREELIGRLSPEYLSPELRDRARRTDAELIQGRKAVSYEGRDRRPGGGYRHGMVIKSPIFNPDGSVSAIIGLVMDITARKEAEAGLQLAAEVFEHSVEGIYIADENNRIFKVNPAFTAITGYTLAEVVGRNPRMLGPEQELPEIFEDIWKESTRSGIWRGELINRRKSGELFTAWVTVIAVRDREGRPGHYIGIFRDITEHKAMEERMRWLAHHDFLTGLANRNLLDDRFDQALRRARRDNTRLALFAIDLNNLKPLNDTFGHATGDEVLKATAKRLLQCVRQTDTVARIGGDEFVIVAADVGDRANADRLARKVLSAICEPVPSRVGNLDVGASIGISFFPDHGASATALLSLADTAMYRIKETGDSGYAIHGA